LGFIADFNILADLVEWYKLTSFTVGVSMLKQDLHIHTTYSMNDSAVVPEQTIALVAAVKHARIVGISDHFENLVNGQFQAYSNEVRKAELKLGVEIDGHAWANEATRYDVDYFIYHCRNQDDDYRALEELLAANRPVIIAHPNALGTDLNRIPTECLIEINNRYIWRSDWENFYGPFKDKFRFVLGSDAHQPNWLGQSVALYAASQLGVEEYLVF
jgi:histidinol phosphatase-like PHP family hydrolase